MLKSHETDMHVAFWQANQLNVLHFANYLLMQNLTAVLSSVIISLIYYFILFTINYNDIWIGILIFWKKVYEGETLS